MVVKKASSVAKKAVAKKTTKKETPAKKTAAKKTAANREAGKKTVAPKPAVKRATATKPSSPKTSAKKTATKLSPSSIADDVRYALDWLEKNSSKKTRDEMGPRYGIHVDKAFGVSMANLKLLSSRLGISHELAQALWDTGWYEARMVASMVDDAKLVTTTQMERWCKDFDNWGICDTVCFKLFDRSPHALSMVEKWCGRSKEFEKRAGFALLACVALHDKKMADAPFISALALIERESTDDRNFVKKSVNWALRAIGMRSATAKREAMKVAERLAASPDATARWNGRDALKTLKRK